MAIQKTCSEWCDGIWVNKYILDTDDDAENLPPAPGSTALSAETGTRFVCNASGEWVVPGTGGSEVTQIKTLIETDMLPAVHTNGAILTDENGNIVLRY